MKGGTPHGNGRFWHDVPGAVQSATAAAANDLMNFSITAPVRVYRGQLSSKLQIYVNSQQVNTVNVAVEVVKE